MDKIRPLVIKYRTLTSEWNKISEIISIYFSACTIGLAFSLIFYSWLAFSVMIVMMAMFAWFEYRARKRYVRSRARLEAEIFRLAGTKRMEVEEIVKRGVLW